MARTWPRSACARDGSTTTAGAVAIGAVLTAGAVVTAGGVLAGGGAVAVTVGSAAVSTAEGAGPVRAAVGRWDVTVVTADADGTSALGAIAVTFSAEKAAELAVSITGGVTETVSR
jgi:hypothetical protein